MKMSPEWWLFYFLTSLLVDLNRRFGGVSASERRSNEAEGRGKSYPVGRAKYVENSGPLQHLHGRQHLYS